MKLVFFSSLTDEQKNVIIMNCLPLCIADSFWTNPQYCFKIDELLSKCSTEQGEKNMLVSLMQKPDKRNRRLVQNLHIGFSVFEVNITLHCSSLTATPTMDI